MPDHSRPDPLAEWLMRLSDAVGVSGHEGSVADLAAREIGRWSDDVRRDRLGDVIAVRRGEGQASAGRRVRVMLAAHMDEIGLMVTRIEKGGTLRVRAVGGVSIQTLLGQPVVVHASGGPVPGVVGVKPPHLTTEEESREYPRWNELFVDCGLGEAETRALIEVGDLITVQGKAVQMLGQRLSGKALDNRASVAALGETLRVLSHLRHRADVLAVATVQEEVGLRGAMVSAFGLEPDLAVAIDVTFAKQRQVSDPEIVDLGKGPAIARGANMHPRIVERLLETAREHAIPHQVEVLPGRSGTDAWAIQVTREGIATGLVSVPLRYMHTPVEVVDVRDVRESARLLAHFVAGMDERWVESLTEWGVETVGARS